LGLSPDPEDFRGKDNDSLPFLSLYRIFSVIFLDLLHVWKDGQPVTSVHVYAVAMRYPDIFVKSEGQIMLMK
jgi:hypothetical protein